MENKNCPNCIKKINSNTKNMEFVCKKSGLKCNLSTCPYERDEYDDHYDMNLYDKKSFDY